MQNETNPIEDFQKALENNRSAVEARRRELYKSSGHFVSANRKSWLKAVVQQQQSRSAS